MVKDAPYVGPRPFQREDRHRFFGRDQEGSELLSLSVAHRAVLLYAPSGAGKSSLLNALVTPLLEEEGFDVLPIARVRGPALQEIAMGDVKNVYLFYTLLSLAGDAHEANRELARRYAQESLSHFLENLPRQEDEFGYPLPRALIFDQFEELFTAYPQRWQDRERFFAEVNAALEKDPLLHVIFSMREDYLAQLDAYANMLPSNLRTRFRLERMRPREALAAVRGPLARTACSYAPGVAEQLVEDLRKTRVESASGQTTTVTGEFVEPVQLQVVCQNLWQDLPEGIETITGAHLRTFGNVDQALSAFYERALNKAVRDAGVEEANLRDWFEDELLTPTGTRSTVHRGPEKTAGIANAAVETLENEHLLRGEWRAGARWYELTHDRLIEPIRDANRRWVEARRERRLRTALQTGGAVVVLLFLALIWSWQADQPAPEAAGALATATVEAQGNATVRAEATQAALSATRESIAGATRAAATATFQANVAGATATIQAEVAEATARARATIDAQVTATTSARATTDTQATATTVARATADAEAMATAFARPVRPLRPGVSIGTADVPSAGTLSAFVQDEGGVRYMLVVWPFSQESGASIMQPSPVDGGQPVTHKVASVSVPAPFSSDSSTAAPNTVAGAELVGMATLEEDIPVRFAPPEISALAGVASPETGMAVTLIGRTSGRVQAEITAVSTTRPISADGVQVALEDVFLLDAPLAAGDQGALVIDADRHLLGIVVATSTSESLAVPINQVLDRLEVELLTLEESLVTFTGHELAVHFADFSPDGQRVVTASRDGTARLWDLDGRQQVAFTGHRTGVSTAVFHPDGERILTASSDKTARLWNLQGTNILTLTHEGWVTSAVFNPAGNRILTTSIDDGTVHIWNLDGDDIFSFEDQAWSAVYNPAGDRILTAGVDGVARLYDLQGNQVSSVGDATATLWSARFNPAGDRIVTAAENNSVRLWDLQGNLLATLTGHTDQVRMAVFNPEGNHILTASWDGTARLWDLEGNDLGVVAEHNAQISSAVFNPAGDRILTSGADDTARLWPVP